MIAPTSAVEENEEKSQRRHDGKRQAPLLRAEAYWAANLSRARFPCFYGAWSRGPFRGRIKDAAASRMRQAGRRGPWSGAASPTAGAPPASPARRAPASRASSNANPRGAAAAAAFAARRQLAGDDGRAPGRCICPSAANPRGGAAAAAFAARGSLAARRQRRRRRRICGTA